MKKVFIQSGMILWLSLFPQIGSGQSPSSAPVTNSLPAQFDLRDVNGVNFVSSVKSQSGGTCWAHGSMAAVEGNLLRSGVWYGMEYIEEPNLAEYHLDWWNGFNQYYNEDIYPTSGGLTVHNGGDYRVMAAYMTRGDGAVYSIDANDNTEKDNPWYYTAPNRTDESFQIFYPGDIEWYSMGENLENIEILKQAIMNHGVLGTCLFSASPYINQDYIHYQPAWDHDNPNHSVAIVGWNDTLATQASQPGVWLCKNSWGSGWGNNGYFWISYYDKHCGHHPEMGAVSFQNVEPLKYDRIYSHDYHGWRDTKTDCEEAFNAFNTTASEYLVAVGFYTAADSVDYTIKIYDTFDTQLSGEVTSKTGFIQYSGYHTAELDTAIWFLQNDSFYIYVFLSRGGHPYDCTSEVSMLLGSSSLGTIVESRSLERQSYYYDSGIWHDLRDVDSTANFCIKGMAIEELYTDVPVIQNRYPKSIQLNQNYPNPFNPATAIRFFVTVKSHVVLTVYDVLGRQIRTLANEEKSAGESIVSWDGKDNRGRDVSSGVYLYRLKANDQIITKRMLLIR